MAQLELASTPATITNLQEDLYNLHCDLSRLCLLALVPNFKLEVHLHEAINTHIHVVGATPLFIQAYFQGEIHSQRGNY